jgi:hypothetical protein
LRDIMRTNDGSKSTALRMAAANSILDRGIGIQSVALDFNLNRSLGELSDDELVALRDRYAARTTATPALLEHLEREEGTADLFADLTLSASVGVSKTPCSAEGVFSCDARHTAGAIVVFNTSMRWAYA